MSEYRLPWRIVYLEQINDGEEFCLYARGNLSEAALEALEEYVARQRARMTAPQSAQGEG